jgi:hypothetical protein
MAKRKKTGGRRPRARSGRWLAPTPPKPCRRWRRKSDRDQARVAAARELLDRAYGKPSQLQEHSGPNGEPIRVLNEIDRASRIAALLAKAVERKEPARKA